MARLDEIDDSIMALDSMKKSPYRDHYLVEMLGEYYGERAVMSYFLLTITPFYLQEIEEACAN